MIAKLRSRWRNPEGLALAARVREALAAGEGIARLGLPLTEGRLDLRGYEDLTGEPQAVDVGVPGTGRSVQFRLRSEPAVIAGRLERLDLGGAQLRSFRFRHAELSDCVFDGADCRDIGLLSSSFLNCSFRNVNFTDAYLGVFDWKVPQSRFESADFTGARFVRGGSSNVVFRNCLFLDVVMRKHEISADFEHCVFSGLLDEDMFMGRSGRDAKGSRHRFSDIDMRGATIRWVGFVGIDLAHVALPVNEHIILRRASCTLPAAIARLEGAQLPARRKLGGLLKSHHDSLAGDVAIMHRLDAGADNEQDAQWAEAFLAEIEAECTKRR